MMKASLVRDIVRIAAVVTAAASLANCSSAGSPGFVGGLSSATNFTMPTGSARPEAGDAKREVFVSNDIGSIQIYTANIHTSNPSLLGTITSGTTRPEGVWIDSAGTLYVANGEQYPVQANIEEYKHGATSPFRTITSGLYYPASVAVGQDGTVYVNSVDGNSTGKVVEYAPGEITPERTITLPDPAYSLAAGDLAFDRNGDLLAPTMGNTVTIHVFKIAPHSSHVTDLSLQKAAGIAIAVDGAGNLYTGGQYQIAVYAPGATKPSRTFPLSFFANGMTVTREGTLYVVGNQTVAEFAPGADSPTNYIDTLHGETGTIDAAVGAHW
jgi:hypothetical protein